MVAIVSILAVCAAVLFPHYVERAKTAEAEIAMAEVKRLETDFFARTGTFSSDLNQIGYQMVPPLKYHTVFVQVEKSPRGWGYMVLLMPNGDTKSGGSYMSQGPDGRILSNVGAQGSREEWIRLGLLRLERMGIHGRRKDRGRRRHLFVEQRHAALRWRRPCGATWPWFRYSVCSQVAAFQRNVIMLSGGLRVMPSPASRQGDRYGPLYL